MHISLRFFHKVCVKNGFLALANVHRDGDMHCVFDTKILL